MGSSKTTGHEQIFVHDLYQMQGVKPQRFREAIMRILDVFQGLTTQQMIQVIEKLP